MAENLSRFHSAPVYRLPPEVLSRILYSLGWKDTLRVTATCRYLRNTYRQDLLQRTRKLFAHFALRFQRPLAIATGEALSQVALTDTEINRLLQVDCGLRRLHFSRRYDFESPSTNLSKAFWVSNGILVHCQAPSPQRSDTAVYAMCVADTSAGSAANPRSWTLRVPHPEVLEVVSMPDVDALAVLYMRTTLNIGDSSRYAMSVYRLSDGVPHPAAVHDININVAFPSTSVTSSMVSSRLRMSNELGAVRLANPRDLRRSYTGLTNWQTGEVLNLPVIGGGLDIEWASNKGVVVPSGGGVLNFFRLISRHPIEAFISARLYLPDLQRDIEITLLTFTAPSSAADNGRGLIGVDTFYDTQRAADVDARRPSCTSDGSQGICAIVVSTKSPGLVDTERSYTLLFALQYVVACTTLDNLLQYDDGEIISATTTAVAATFRPLDRRRMFLWREWGNEVGRLIRNFDAHDYSLCIVGWKILERRRALDPYVNVATASLLGTTSPLQDTIVLTDLNPGVNARYRPLTCMNTLETFTLQGEGEWVNNETIHAFVRTVSHRTVLLFNRSRQHVWHEHIDSRLPYRQVVSNPEPPISYVVLDEGGRIWVLRMNQVALEGAEDELVATWRVLYN